VEAELLTELDSTQAEQDETRNDAKGIALAKQDLEWSLQEVIAEATNLRLQKLDTKTSIWW
ncbi:hypothetical protein ACLOJK_004993, partial [Asimina triloba]